MFDEKKRSTIRRKMKCGELHCENKITMAKVTV